MKTGFIDWTDDKLTLYIFGKQGKGVNPSETYTIAAEGYPDADALSSFAVPHIDKIYLSLPLSALTFREQVFPFAESDKIRDTINFELEGMLLGSVNDYAIDHIITESQDNGSKVLAACIEKSKLSEIIDLFSSAGIEPKAITSIDLRLSQGKIDTLFEAPVSDPGLRAAAAEEELLNPSINLRQGEHTYTGDVERFKKKIKFTAVLVLILLTILGTLSYVRYMDAKKQNDSLKTQLKLIYKKVFPEDKKIIDAERQFAGNLNSLKKRKAVLAGIPLLDILKDISLKTSNSITLSEFSSDKTNLIIKGVASSFKDVDALKNNLSSSFVNIKVTNSKATADNKIDFTIVMKERTA